jgi:hypothetical protein
LSRVKTAILARVLWGDNTLCVAHLAHDGRLFVGDGDDVACVLPVPRTFIASFSNGVATVADRTLAVGDREHVALGDFTVVVEHTSATTTVPKDRRLPRGTGAVVASALLHAALVGALAHALPGFDPEITALDRETTAYLLARTARAEAEINTPDPKVLNNHRRASGVDDGAASAGSSGKLGTKRAPPRDTYFMVKGDAERLAIVRGQIESGHYGVLSALTSALARTTPQAGFADTMLANDPRTFLGNLDGTIPGDSFGGLGLAPLGAGNGGGGEGVGIGLGLTGTGFGGCGCGEGGLLGHGWGRTAGMRLAEHRPKPVIIDTSSASSFTGSLPAEAIRRVIRANFPRFRQCYDQGLKRDPSLAGSVGVRFIIDTTGAVESASLANGTLNDAAVRACVLGVYSTLSFPEPPGGKVMVTYPIDFQIE